MNAPGHDADGKEYHAPDELWRTAADGDGSHNTWYQKAVEYWDQQDASYNGVLGGYGFVSEVDVRDSRTVLLKAFSPQLKAASEGQRQLVAVDCGAGVGRVTEQLLLHHFQEVRSADCGLHCLLSTASHGT